MPHGLSGLFPHVTLTLFVLLLLLADGMALAEGPSAPAAAKRLDDWTIIGMGGGGAQYFPTISPHDPQKVLVRCDMTGSFVSLDGGGSWRMMNFRSPASFFVWDPVYTDVAYVNSVGLYRTTDNCKTWQLVHPHPSNVTGVVDVGDHGGSRLVTTGADERLLALAVDPDDSKTLYAVMSRGSDFIFRVSNDWGETWQDNGRLPWSRPPRLPGGTRKIHVDPRSPKADRTIYVIGDHQVSLREGGEWFYGRPPQGTEPFIYAALGFAKDAARPVVYALTPPSRQGGLLTGGVIVSDDGGDTWRQSNDDWLAWGGGRMPRLFAVATCLTDPSVAYLSIRFGSGNDILMGIARTTNTGRRWDFTIRETFTGISPRVRGAWLNRWYGPDWGEQPLHIGVAPTDPRIVFTTDLGRTMRSTDGLETFQAVYSRQVARDAYTTTGLDVTTCYGVHFDPFDDNHIFISYTDVGLFHSADRGSSWAPADVPRDWRNTTYWIELDPDVKGRAWAVMSGNHDLPRPKMWRGRATLGYVGGVAVSDDSGRTWRKSTAGMPPTAATHVLMDPASPPKARTLYVCGFGTGVWKSTDDGKSWTLKNKGIEGDTPFAWRITRDRDGVLYLVVARRSDDGSIGNPGDGALYKSTDGAENWRKMNLPQGVNGPNGLAVDPDDPQRMYLAAWGRSSRDGDTDGGVYLSTDGGASWESVLSRYPHTYDVTIDPAAAQVIYACGFNSSVLRSDDRGQTWRRLPGYNFKWGHRVIPDPKNPAMIFVATYGGSVWYGPSEGDPEAADDIVTPVVAYK